MAKQHLITLRNGEQIKLTEKEMMFCEYYLGEANKNATQAAKKAGYSEKTARNIANQNLAKLHIKKYLDDKTAPLMEALGITQDRILKKLRDIAFTDLSDLTDDDWNLLPKSQIPKEFHSALGSVEIDEKVLMQEGEAGLVVNRKIKYRLKQQEKALLTLADMAGMIPKNNDKELPGAQGPSINLFQQINNYIQGK